MTAALEVRDLHAGYDGVSVLRGIDLSVLPGELVVLVGPNGHGKTTLVRTISGLLRPTQGTVAFAGDEVTGWAAERIAARGLVHVPQGDLLFRDLSVEENLLLGAYAGDAWGRRAERLAEVFTRFPQLEGRRRQRSATLSGGERRMLAIGRGLMSDPQVLILDEPSLGLSPALVDEVYALIRTVVEEGTTMLLVEENFAHVEDFDGRVVLIEDGRVAQQGPIAEVARDERLLTTYLGR